MLDHVANATAQQNWIDRVGIATADEDFPRRRSDQAIDHPQRRRLAASRRAEQHADIAFVDFEADVVDRRDIATRRCVDTRHSIEPDHRK